MSLTAEHIKCGVVDLYSEFMFCSNFPYVFPRSDATATINFPLLALAATIPRAASTGGRQGGVNYTLHDSLLFSSINFDYVMFKSTIFGSDYC